MSEKQTHAMNKAAEMAQRAVEGLESPNLVLLGPPGTGKTFTACYALDMLCKKKTPCQILTAGQLSLWIRSTYDKKNDDESKLKMSENSVIAMLTTVPLLVVDEIGEVGGSDFDKRQLSAVLEGRYDNCLPTILISNLSREEFDKELGPRVVSRLRQDGCDIIPMTGKDLRGKE